jgi:hypothetical protein
MPLSFYYTFQLLCSFQGGNSDTQTKKKTIYVLVEWVPTKQIYIHWLKSRTHTCDSFAPPGRGLFDYQTYYVTKFKS